MWVMRIGGPSVVDMLLRYACTGMVAVRINAANTGPKVGSLALHMHCGCVRAMGATNLLQREAHLENGG